MIKFTSEITIERPLGEVFSFVSDPCNNPKWNYYILHVEKTNEDQGVGAAYLQIRKKDQQRFHITSIKTNKRFVTQTLPRVRPAGRREMIFEGDDNITRIQDRMELKTFLPGFIARLFSSAPKRAVKQNLEKLKVLLETGHVALQDGRRVEYQRTE